MIPHTQKGNCHSRIAFCKQNSSYASHFANGVDETVRLRHLPKVTTGIKDKFSGSSGTKVYH